MSNDARATRRQRLDPPTSDAQSLRQIQVLKGLSDPELAAIAELASFKSFAANTQAVLDSELHERVFFIVEGEGRILAISPSGAVATMAKFASGDAFGVSECMINHSYGHHVTRLQCLQPAILVMLKRKDFRKLVEQSPTLCLACLHYISGQQAELATRFYELSTLDVRGRLLAELTRLARRARYTAGRLTIDAAPTHSQLGEMIGAAREAVTRQLLLLEGEGLIEIARRKIVINDPKYLAELDERTAGRRQFLDHEP